MHPEKLVNGSYGNSGVKFLLWSHSVDRFSGNRNLVASPEFSFFFHTILWAFLPWTVLLVTGVFSRCKELWETRFASFFSREQLSFAGVWAIFILMSFAKFKLPHYLNILFPLMSIFSAAWLWQLRENGQSKTIRQLFRVQKGIIAILLCVLMLIIFWSFPLKSPWVAFGILGISVLLWQLWRQDRGGMADRVVLLTATAALLVNFVLNTHFYPTISKYQGGSTMAGIIKEQGIDTGSVYLYGKIVRSLDFYTQRFTPVIDSAGISRELSKGRTLRLYTTENSGDTLRMQYPRARAVISTPNQKITRLKLSFLNPAKREESMPKAVLYELRPEGIP
jgi:4-amino-4-deoxy-L-arabinose transferase-like glycosyltransferase